MKELDQKIKAESELSVNQKKQVEYDLIGQIIPHEGHVIWEINKETLEIKKAKFSNIAYVFGQENKNEIIQKEGFFYVSAINKKNALRKYKQGRNGTKIIDKAPLKIGF